MWEVVVTAKARSGFFKYFVLSLIILFAIALFFLCSYIMRMDVWNTFDPERILGAAETTIIYDAQNTEIRRLHGAEDRVSIDIDDLPSYVPNAFISAEDARFYSHRGLDFIRIIGAVWADIKAGGYVQGASTISQQLIKLSHLSSEKTIDRKLEEAVLAYQMERVYSKDEILSMYMNYVYFGGGYYGIEAASKGYFGINASRLSVAQSAMLAGILKAPSNYAPHLDMDACKGRRDMVLGLMCDYGYITEAQRDQARNEEIKLVKGKEDGISFVDYSDTAIREACAILDIDSQTLHSGGYRIYTALDRDIQGQCEEIFSNDDFFPDPSVQSAIVIQRTNSGLVCALLGGRNNMESMNFNRATNIRRQPGSVIKPIMCYAPALENRGYTAATMLLDARTSFGDYSPDNYAGKYYGWVTMREAVTRSLNIPAVKVLSDVGVQDAMDFASRLGIEFYESDASLALALGGFTYGVSPWMITGAYNCFASGGIFYSPAVICSIEDNGGNVLYRYEDGGERVISEQNAYILTSMLQSVVSEGTGHRLGELDMDIAGKTGTVEEATGNRDAWMVAYNPEYTASIWMGYDSSADGSLPEAATGGKYPALMLHRLFGEIYKHREAPRFDIPAGVVEASLDGYALRSARSLALAGIYTPEDSIVREVFADGTQPTKTSGYWDLPLPPTNFTLDLSAHGYPLIRFTPRQKHTEHWIYRQSETGQNTRIAVIAPGAACEYTDVNVLPGESYTYYIIAVHPESAVNGMSLESAPTLSQHIELTSFSHDPLNKSSGDSSGILDFSSMITDDST